MRSVDYADDTLTPKEVADYCLGGKIHNYTILRRDYYKPDGNRMTDLGVQAYKQGTSFTMLYCTQCGGTKEVASSG